MNLIQFYLTYFNVDKGTESQNNLRYEGLIAGDGKGEPEELPVSLLLLLVRQVGDLQARGIVGSGRHSE